MKRSIFSVWATSTIFISTLLFLAALNARAQIIYSNGFSNPVGSEWSSTQRSTTPVGGRQFLGQFGGNQSVSLALSSLPAHTQLTLTFDLFIIASWDGNDIPGGGQADIFDVSIQGGTNLLHTTFENDAAFSHRAQAYPGPFPGSSFPGMTGASETNTLGYSFDTGGGNVFGDTVYRLSVTFAHSASAITVNFASSLNQSIDDESWGLDNVVVAIPEPSSLALCGFAAIYLMALRRRAGTKVK